MRRNPAGLLERTLALRLREVARKKGRPLYVVAELAGFSRPAFWAILNQASSPTLNTVQRLAEALGVGPLELLEGEPAPVAVRKPRRSAKAKRPAKAVRDRSRSTK